MDYARFARQRAAAWDAAAADLASMGKKGPAGLDFEGLERFASRHRALAADLAWLRTHHPDSEAERRVRGLVFAGHLALTPPAEPLSARAWRFFRVTYPETFRAALPTLRLALGVLGVGMFLGFAFCVFDERLGAVFIGAEPMAMLRSGHIWTDTLEADGTPAYLATRIFVNNIAVAMIAWAGGALWGLGTTLALLQNGAMLGAAFAVCYRYGITDRLFAFIPAHGMLEMFLFTVAGAAGYELARGALAPAEGGRGAVFGAATRRSLRIVGGTVPWFVLLGLVEGFLSPLMLVPTAVKAVVGVFLLSVFLLYTLAPRSSS
jgi:uncharacterized membrane protein SpoIIM required for sporulation